MLYVASRLDDAYEGTVWFPTFNNGVIKVSGRIGPKSNITLDFREVVYGQSTAQKPGVFGDAYSSGTLERDRIVTTGKSKAQGPVLNLTYRLSRAK